MMSIGFHSQRFAIICRYLIILIPDNRSNVYRRQYNIGVMNTDVHLVRDKYGNDVMRDKSDTLCVRCGSLFREINTSFRNSDIYNSVV